MNYDDIGIRMKNDYEDRYRFELTRRVPIIIRIDGRSFHSFCKNFAKPYDIIVMGGLSYSVLLERLTGQTGLKVIEDSTNPIFIG
jgi:tRNA(His) 5'-end guanylyltransferase